MTVQIQLRRGTASQWTSSNPTLALAEMGIETDTNYFKIGNGSTAWNSLAYGGLQGYVGSMGYTGSKGIASLGTTPPASPINGDLWWDTETGNRFIYYDDGTSSQWVQDTALGPAGVIGYTGSQGPIGYTGSFGYTGSASTVIGYTGSLGYTGSQGVGYTGSAANITDPQFALILALAIAL